MADSDRLKRLRELHKALESRPPGASPAPPGEDAAEEEPSPAVGARPSGSAGAAAGAVDTAPSPRARTDFPPAGACDQALPEVFPEAPPPEVEAPPSPERYDIEAPPERVEARLPLPGTVPGTAAELPGDLRGPAFLPMLEGVLSPIAALEPWHVVVASVVLFFLTALAVAASAGNGGWTAAVGLSLTALLLPPILRILCTLLFRAIVIPGIRVRLDGLQWSAQQRRAQVAVALSGDLPLRPAWRHSVRVSLGSRSAPAKPLSVGASAFDGGSKLDLALLMDAPPYPVDAAIVWVTCPDGRSLGLDAPVLRWREAKCARCRGEDFACPLCAGTGLAQEATF